MVGFRWDLDAVGADARLVRGERLHIDELASTALRFILAGQAVSTVIVGMGSMTNEERNATVADAPPLTAEEHAQLARHRWPMNFYS